MKYKKPPLAQLCCFLIAVTFLSVAIYSPAKTQPTEALSGAVTDSIQSDSDPTQTYAVYLPSNYTADRKWPVVFIMDPRGRAMNPLNRFKKYAEELGYILLSSYDTMSDGPDEPTVKALNAMLDDANKFFSIDQQRHYLAGFSGTARISWIFGYQIPDQVAGIIGFGAGVAHGMVLPAKVALEGTPFSFYGGSGYHDFNYLELVEMEKHLEEMDLQHKMVFYEGSHFWPPDSVWYKDALKWMHLQAMKEELIPHDDSFLRKYYLESLQQIAAKKDIYEEYQALQDLMNSFEGMVQHSKEIQKRYRNLGRSRSYRKLEEYITNLINQFRTYIAEADQELKKLYEDNPPSSKDIIQKLGIKELQEQAENSSNHYAARWAQVMLELNYVQTSFYIPRKLLEDQNPEIVPVSLEIALAIKPPNIRTHLFYLRAYNAMGEFEPAWEHVSQLFELGVSPEYLESDTQLQELTKDARFQELVTNVFFHR